jgi:hypothetical protein
MYTFYDSEQNLHKLAMGGLLRNTGLQVGEVVARDFQVRAFDLDDFRDRDLLYVWDGKQNLPDFILEKSG